MAGLAILPLAAQLLASVELPRWTRNLHLDCPSVPNRCPVQDLLVANFDNYLDDDGYGHGYDPMDDDYDYLDEPDLPNSWLYDQEPKEQ